MRLVVMVVVLPSDVLVLWPAQALSLSPGSAVPLVSQPSSALGAAGCEQSLHGALHVGVQALPVQARLAALLDEQARPQAPQLATSLPRLVVQPAVLSAAQAP